MERSISGLYLMPAQIKCEDPCHACVWMVFWGHESTPSIMCHFASETYRLVGIGYVLNRHTNKQYVVKLAAVMCPPIKRMSQCVDFIAERLPVVKACVSAALEPEAYLGASPESGQHEADTAEVRQCSSKAARQIIVQTKPTLIGCCRIYTVTI